jgi:hypothetical protein
MASPSLTMAGLDPAIQSWAQDWITGLNPVMVDEGVQ